MKEEQETNKRLFKQYVKGSNFMTPAIIEYKKIQNKEGTFVLEISEGRRIFSEGKIYGVTVVQLGKGRRDDMSFAYPNMESVNIYIQSLTNTPNE